MGCCGKTSQNAVSSSTTNPEHKHKGGVMGTNEVVNWHGNLQKHSCTDVVCLILFVVFIGAWVVVGIISIRNGDIEKVRRN